MGDNLTHVFLQLMSPHVHEKHPDMYNVGKIVVSVHNPPLRAFLICEKHLAKAASRRLYHGSWFQEAHPAMEGRHSNRRFHGRRSRGWDSAHLDRSENVETGQKAGLSWTSIPQIKTTWRLTNYECLALA